MKSEILELAKSGEDIYTKLAEECLGGPCTPVERAFTKVVFYSLLYGETREETEKKVAAALKMGDVSLVLSRRQALQKRYPELGTTELQTKFALVVELSDLRQELDRRIDEICG